MGAQHCFSFWGRFWGFLSMRGARKVSVGRAPGDRLPQPRTPGDWDPSGSCMLLPRQLLLELVPWFPPWGLLDLTLHLYHGN